MVSVALLAANHGLVYYSSEVKQYAVEIAAAAMLLLVGLALLRRPLRPWRVVPCALAGVVVGWTSFTACYGLAAVGAALVVDAHARRDRRSLLAAGLLGVLWLSTAVVPVFLHTRLYPSTVDPRVLARYWADGFPPTSGVLDALRWPVTALDRVVRYLLEPRPIVWTVGLATLVLLVGALILVRVGLAARPQLAFLLSAPILVAVAGGLASFNTSTGRLSTAKVLWALYLLALILGSLRLARRRPEIFTLVAGPIVLAVLGAALRLYPFRGRAALFLIPSLLLLVGEGIGAAWSSARWWARASARAAGALLVAGAFTTILTFLPEYGEELRPVLANVYRMARPGDSVYVLNGGVRAFEYYQTRLPHPPLEVTLGCCATNQWPRYVEAFRALSGRPRVWFVMTHWKPTEPDFLLLALDRFGKRRLELRARAAAAYLYELPPIDSQAVRDVLAVVPPERSLPEVDWSCGSGPDSVRGCPTAGLRPTVPRI